MIVDCYTHTWESADQLGRCAPRSKGSARSGGDAAEQHGAGISRHLAACEPVSVTIVLGFRSRYLRAEIANEFVASYVRSHADHLIGFAGIDPSDPREAIAELRRVRDELGMPGIAVAPAAQDFHPSHSQAMRVYSAAADAGMPILFHAGVYVTAATKLEYARPVLLDEVARELPNAKIIVAHMGHPWVNETIALLGKHENVFAEISGLLQHPWEAYETLSTAYQYGVMNKLLFGSGFPQAAASQCIETLYGINHLCHGSNLPTIPRDQLRGIVERDTLAVLGIASPRPGAQVPRAASPVDSDDGTEL